MRATNTIQPVPARIARVATTVGFMLLLFGGPCLGQNIKADSLIAKLANAKDTAEVSLLNQISESLRKSRAKEAIEYGERALSKAESISFEAGIMNAHRNIGLAHGYNNDLAQAIDHLSQCAIRAETLKDYKVAANCYMNIGSMYSVLGDNQQWLESYLHALTFSEKAGDKKGTASLLYGIGNSFASEKKYKQALENYNRSIELFEELGEKGELPKVYANMGRMYEDSTDYTKALEYYDKALTEFARFKNKRGRASALTFRANTYFLQHRYAEALTDLDESLSISTEQNYQFAIPDALLLKGKIFLAEKDYGKAIDALQKALPHAKKLGSKSNLSNLYRTLSEVYFAKGDYISAYKFQGLHTTYQDSTMNAERSRQIQEMQFRFQTAKREQEIATLRRDQFLNKVYLGVGLTVVALMVAIGMLAVNRQRLKIRKDRELSQKENQILEEKRSLIEAELANRLLNEERLKTLIDYNNKEMTTYALNLIQKNELLDNIKAGIEEIRSSDADQIKSKLQSLLNTVNYSFHLDKDWENFRMHFEQVHQSFFDKLNELYPDLGPNDLKLCALIRLNLDTKALATVLDISPESAKVARHRLRKKLNLAADQNLASYLVNL